MDEKDKAMITGSIIGVLAFAAVNVTVVKIKERRAKKAAEKAEAQTEKTETE